MRAFKHWMQDTEFDFSHIEPICLACNGFPANGGLRLPGTLDERDQTGTRSLLNPGAARVTDDARLQWCQLCRVHIRLATALARQLFAAFIKTDQSLGILRPMIDLKRIFHGTDELGIRRRRNTPLLPLSSFFLASCTVSLENARPHPTPRIDCAIRRYTLTAPSGLRRRHPIRVGRMWIFASIPATASNSCALRT